VGEIVVPNEMARQLGVTPLRFRNWLRAQRAAGDPLLAGHVHGQRWEFSRADADRLMAEYAEQRSGGGRPRHRATRVASPSPPRRKQTRKVQARAAVFARSDDPGHRVTEEWMGEEVETLADLLRPGLRAVVVGINPAPTSVAAGHYYQGRSGERFFSRLASVDLLPSGDGFEDDRAFAAGIGFTDVVKRPTPGAKDLRPGELEHGRTLLEDKLAALAVPLLIFTFKGAATPLLGSFDGHGSLGRRRLADARIFVMPGPMEKRERVTAALAQLRGLAR
jgi:TDG/mug DNA glycosylase family protein